VFEDVGVSVRVLKTVGGCWCEWGCVGVGDTVARVCVFVCGYLIAWHNCWCECVGVGVSVGGCWCDC